MKRTRIKFCGLTRFEDMAIAADLGVDAFGFNFFPASSRYIPLEKAAELARLAPPFIERIGLFVDASPEAVLAVLAKVPLDCLQFHGDEDEQYCVSFGLPYLKTISLPENDESKSIGVAAPALAKVTQGLAHIWEDFIVQHSHATAYLLDTKVEGYGGSGKSFHWENMSATISLCSKPIVLAGGLREDNVASAIALMHPYAVDVCSGIESQPGIKDMRKMQAFVASVRLQDMQSFNTK